MYSHLKSYSDEGAQDSKLQKITFKTVYKSPGKLYFQYTDTRKFLSKTDTWFLYSSGKKDLKGAWLANAYLFGKVEHKPLTLEIAGFTGISRGTAYLVPTMLFSGIGGRMFHDSKDAVVLRNETMGGESCYVVNSKKDNITLWISTKSLALRQVIELGETTTYKPRLNPKVDDKVFAFPAPTVHH